MNIKDHIYFTRSKMNTQNRSVHEDNSELGITKPIRVYSLKTIKNTSKPKISKTKKNKIKSKTSKTKKYKIESKMSKTKYTSVDNIFQEIHNDYSNMSKSTPNHIGKKKIIKYVFIRKYVYENK